MTSIAQGHGGVMGRTRMRLSIDAAAVVCLLLAFALVPYAVLRHPLSFDDAYIVLRYALNLRKGLGIAWNPDGAPTHGLASQLWVFFVLPFTYFHFSAAAALQTASWFAGMAAIAVMTMTVARNSTAIFLRYLPLSFVAVALPLLINPRFVYHLTSGMDTMLSLLADALLVFGIFEYLAHPSLRRAVFAGFFGFVAILARPENCLCALAAPLLAWVILLEKPPWKDILAFLAVLLTLTGVDLWICGDYFGAAFPLEFYARSFNTYAGFTSTENALEYAFAAVACAIPFIGVLGATLDRRHAGLSVALLLPAAATALCLVTLRQHMGFNGRYYVPLLPFFVVPALLGFDRALSDHPRRSVLRAAAGVAGAILLLGLSLPLQRYLSHEYLVMTLPQPVPAPLITSARDSLPAIPWTAAGADVGRLVARLPAEVVVAAAEVGFVGYASQDKYFVDLEGTNDNDIGLHGFSMDGFLAKRVDFIWLPPPDFTGLRAAMFSDPRFLARYSVIAGAFNYGVALRRDSPDWNSMESALASAWDSAYPGRMIEDYTVRSPVVR